MDKRLKDKVTIVTGAASGIGAATATRFVKEGAAVLLVDQNGEGAANIARQIDPSGQVAKSIEADVNDENAVRACVRMAIEHWHRIDILVNNAGIGSDMDLLEFTSAEFDRIMGVNLKGPLMFCKHTIPAMRNGGAIVNITSISSTSGITGQPLYAPSKGGLLQMTRQLAVEYAQRNIRVNAVSPGTIETPMLTRPVDDPAKLQEQLDWLLMQHPIGRFGAPEEVANAILFLASDEASFITGANLAVDGGYTAQ